MSVDAGRTYLTRRAGLAFWFGFFGSPLAWFFELFFIYPAVPYACQHKTIGPVLVCGILGLVVSVAAGFVAYSIWKDTGAELPGEHATRVDRTRMMMVIGMLFSWLFSSILIGQIIATFVLGPCLPIPRFRFTPDAQLTPPPALYAQLEARLP